jgi:CSLREA domain-containing protein
MARQGQTAQQHIRSATFSGSCARYRRQLHLEPLEDRRVLAVVTVTTLTDTIDFNDGVTSLREAIFSTNTVPGADSIEFAPTLTVGGPAKILLTGGELAISDALSITGPGADRLTIDAQQQSRIFNITATSGSSIISGLSLTGGKTTSSGGALRSVGVLTVINCVVENSQVTGSSADGGGVFSAGTLSLVDTVIRNNKAAGSGGGVFAQTLTLDHSTVSGNSSLGGISGGGGIFCTTLTTLNGSVISGNTTVGGISPGGGVYATNATLNHTTVSGNKTLGGLSEGGGIYSKNQVTLSNSIVTGNSSSSEGGGISAPSVRLYQSTVFENTADRRGGGIYCSKLTMNQTNVSGNITYGDGGGIYAKSLANITTSTISGNSASNSFSRGGGIFSSGSLSIDRSVVSNNEVVTGINDGGGIFSRGNAQISDSTVSQNTATSSGGGIAVDGTGSLTLIRTIVSNNSAGHSGGIDVSSGATTIVGCSITGNQAGDRGGGIICLGPLAVSDSRIVGNTAGSEGGGIFCYGALSLTNTTVESNEAGGDGGGAFSYGNIFAESCTISNNVASESGGGVVANGSIQLSNSTISQNTATSLAGGIWCRGPTATISHSTIYRNRSSGAGGGVFMDSGALSLDNSIVAGNFAESGLDATGLLGASIQAWFSLIGNNSGSGLPIAPVGSPDANGNLVGGSTFQTAIDPKLVQLADNGGSTRTHALLASSPALNTGNPNAVVPLFDQRGAPFTRIYGGRVDMGSYERQSLTFTDFVVDTLADEYDGNFSSGQLSLREAIALANADVGSAKVITFAPSLTAQGPAVILLTRGDLAITDSLTVTGPGAALLSIDASGNKVRSQSGKGSRVFSIDDGDATTKLTISMSGLTLTGGDLTDSGGAILSHENLTVADSVIRDNFAGTGGGIHSAAPLTLINCTVSGNTAANSGGAILNGYANTTATGCSITGNSALQGDGGGIRSYGSNSVITLYNSVLSDNSAVEGFGGGIYTYGRVTFNDGVVARNVSQGGGGVLALGPITVTNSVIAHNTSTLYAGGGLQAHGSLNVVGSTIIANSANAWHGGGIIAQGAVSVTNSTLSENSALEGGALYYSGASSVTIAFSTITANVATSPSGRAGGIFFGGSSLNSLNLNGSIVAANSGPFGPDVFAGASAKTNITYCLIGDKSGTPFVEAPVGSADAKGNLIGGPVHGVIDPKLGPIAYNGGPTFLDGSKLLTRALLPGSPAINAGDPAAVAGVGSVPLHDQRGIGFHRVRDGRIDIGAFELQPIGPALPGDYNDDYVVDAADYVLFRKFQGTNTPLANDAVGGQLGSAHYQQWRENFGKSLPGSRSTGGEAGFVGTARESQLARTPQVVEMSKRDGDAAAWTVRALEEPMTPRVPSFKRVRIEPAPRADGLERAMFALLDSHAFVRSLQTAPIDADFFHSEPQETDPTGADDGIDAVFELLDADEIRRWGHVAEPK